MKQAHIKPINCRIAPLKNKPFRKIAILTIFVDVVLNEYYKTKNKEFACEYWSIANERDSHNFKGKN